jgi:hypothetical protein
MYPESAPGDAFHIDIKGKTDYSTKGQFDSKPWNSRSIHPNDGGAINPPPTMVGLTFEDITVAAVKSTIGRSTTTLSVGIRVRGRVLHCTKNRL